MVYSPWKGLIGLLKIIILSAVLMATAAPCMIQAEPAALEIPAHIQAERRSTFKSYMSWKSITNRRSKQWALQQEAWTDANGLRRHGKHYIIAVGSGWGFKVGDIVKVSLSSGKTFTAVLGDSKSDRHTDKTNRYSRNGCWAEFIVDIPKLDPYVRRSGDISNAGFPGYVVSIEKYAPKCWPMDIFLE